MSLKKWIWVLLITFTNIQFAYFVKCKQTILELNSLHSHPSSERERKFCWRLFTSSIKHDTRHFHLMVMQQWYINVQKRMMHMQSCCFVFSTYCFYDVLIAVAIVASWTPYNYTLSYVNKKSLPKADWDWHWLSIIERCLPYWREGVAESKPSPPSCPVSIISPYFSHLWLLS